MEHRKPINADEEKKTTTPKKKISLTDIVRSKKTIKPLGDNDSIEVVTKKDVKVKPRVDSAKEAQDEYLKKIDDGFNRVKREIYTERIKPFIDEQKKIAEEKEFDGEIEVSNMAEIAAYKAQHSSERAEMMEIDTQIDEEPKAEVSNTTPDFLDKPITEIDFNENDFDNDLIDDEKDTSDSELNDDADEEKEIGEDEEDKKAKEQEQQEKEKEELKMKSEIVKQYITPETIDLSGFTESGKTININTAINHISETNKNFTESKSVVLYNTGRTIAFTPLTGSEIVALSSDNFTSELELYKKSFYTMYTHDVSPDKPKTFTAWAKGIDAGDLQQMYFGLYNATFGDANFIGYQCSKCNSFFMKKFPIRSMWDFNKESTEEQKERFMYINEHGESEDNFKTKSKRYNLSKDYIIQLKPRSIYNLLEINYLDNDFRRKYDSILRAMGYIDKVFFVDYKHSQLIPVDFKVDKDSIVKTIKNKCIVLYKVLTSITPDNYSLFTGMVYNYYLEEAKAMALIKYHIPAIDCHEVIKEGVNKGQVCNEHIDELEVSPYNMLFTRHQLVMQSTLHVD
jgi:hypothetical protein